MDITLTNRVPDVYEQNALIEKAITDAYSDGLGALHITVVEPANTPNWHWSVIAEDGKRYLLEITAFDQIDLAALPKLLKQKLRDLISV